MSYAKPVLAYPHSIPKVTSPIALVMTKTMMVRNRKGERMQPCLVPILTSNNSIFQNASLHTEAGMMVDCLEYVDEFIREREERGRKHHPDKTYPNVRKGLCKVKKNSKNQKKNGWS